YPSAQDVFVGANDIVADPRFVDVQPDPTKGNFRLAKDSRGQDSGCNEVAQPTDITGKARPAGAGKDRGAFEQ
ncbi:MAG: hypothetical protein H7Z75_15115, partial [Ferruginibacter sp.]|nr:hypothetical protein [Cytophagales bacterium]